MNGGEGVFRQFVWGLVFSHTPVPLEDAYRCSKVIRPSVVGNGSLAGVSQHELRRRVAGGGGAQNELRRSSCATLSTARGRRWALHNAHR